MYQFREPHDPGRLWADLDALSEFRQEDVAGWSRPSLSEPYERSRGWLRERMTEAGLDVRVDPIGNSIGVLPGSEPDLPAIVIGSHTDSVPGGGRFDGILGVLSSIEVIRLLRDHGIRLRHPVWVVDFFAEEWTPFGTGLLGSKAVAGNLGAEVLALEDDSGTRLEDALLASGRDVSRLDEARWNPPDVAAYVELHIEQGRVLEQLGVSIGVVEAIVGIHRVRVTVQGRPDHAGTTPMDHRRDALCAAAEAILAIERIASDHPPAVGTVGNIQVSPGAGNVVPGRVVLEAEFRSADVGWLQARRPAVDGAVREIAERRDLQAATDWHSAVEPVEIAPQLHAAITRAADLAGIASHSMPSGAGHDAMQVASLAPIGMIFVPSRDGRSHVPEEWTDPAEAEKGVRVLAQTLCVLDEHGNG